MLAPLTATTVLAGFPAASSSARGLGIAAIGVADGMARVGAVAGAPDGMAEAITVTLVMDMATGVDTAIAAESLAHRLAVASVAELAAAVSTAVAADAGK
jgi:hypothetical protein